MSPKCLGILDKQITQAKSTNTHSHSWTRAHTQIQIWYQSAKAYIQRKIKSPKQREGDKNNIIRRRPK